MNILFKDDIDKCHENAVRCRKAAHDPARNATEASAAKAAKALKLAKEWESLQIQSSGASPKDSQKKKAKLLSLCKRMESFLAENT